MQVAEDRQAADEYYYVAEERQGGGVLVTFGEFVDDRTPETDDELRRLVELHDPIAFDVSATIDIPSEWLRFFCSLTQLANDTGKSLALVGLREAPSKNADIIGLRDCLELVENLDAVWPS